MTTSKQLPRLPLLLAVLSALLILLGAGLLLANLSERTTSVEMQRGAQELSATVDSLSRIVKSTDTDWVQSDQLAQLIASGDVQVQSLTEQKGVFSFLSFTSRSTDLSEVKADWKLLREGLLSFNKASQLASSSSTDEIAARTPDDSVANTTLIEEPSEVTDQVAAQLTAQLATMASEFEQVRALVTEGTRTQSLLDLVNSASLEWAQVYNSPVTDLPGLVVRQQAYASELLRLTKVGTETSLFGYYTSNQILDYTQRINSLQLPQATLVSEPLVSNPGASEPRTRELRASEEQVAKKVETVSPVPNSAFVTEALQQLKRSVAGVIDRAGSLQQNRRSIWLVLSTLGAALLTLLLAFSTLWRATSSSLATTVTPPEPARSSALTVRDADQLIEDINALADGDLRHSVYVPGRGHGKAIAESVNRSGAIMQNLVGMARGVADRIGKLVQQHEKFAQVLAEQDIRRQSETAELSDSIGVRSAMLDQQQKLLSSATGISGEIASRCESAAKGTNHVSASLASVSAQVEVSNERMQRLLQTSRKVAGYTNQLKQLAEQTRLQALNVSLKIPAQTTRLLAEEVTESVTDYGHDDAQYTEDKLAMFDDIHLLTGKLVQISNDTEALISNLNADIEGAAQALKISGEEITESARHTHAGSLLSKELDGNCDRLQSTLKNALSNIDTQQDELAESAERIVQLDKAGNSYSQLTLGLTQDVAELQAMAAKLEESVDGFKIRGDAAT